MCGLTTPKSTMLAQAQGSPGGLNRDGERDVWPASPRAAFWRRPAEPRAVRPWPGKWCPVRREHPSAHLHPGARSDHRISSITKQHQPWPPLRVLGYAVLNNSLIRSLRAVGGCAPCSERGFRPVKGDPVSWPLTTMAL